MKQLSRAISTLGLLAVVTGLILFPQAMAEGETLYRWDKLSLGLCAGLACFLLAALIAGRSRDD